ncbi:DUF2837 family protein [bacterium]|nr:DUF2837 family protein [bacterium]
MPAQMLPQVIVAGLLLGFMSIVDTLAYCFRTAGVLRKRLAISLALFNATVVFARTSNLIQAPILANLSDKSAVGVYTDDEVLAGLRIALLFIAVGVVLGALLTPTFIAIAARGVELLEETGTLPRTVLYGLKRIGRLPRYFVAPSLARAARYLDLRSLPRGFLLFNIPVTCFYSIGVMSTLLAASWDPSVAMTNAYLSGIVNGIATLLLFIIVDPPAAVVIDQCIAGKRPVEHAKTMNLYLIVTRLAGVLLGLLLLPLMARIVLAAAQFVNWVFSAN